MTLPSASSETHEVMTSWHLAKPIVGLMGEFSSGKSTLLNFILGQDVATTRVTATPLPPIWLTYSETPFCVGLLEDGALEDVDLTDPDVDFRQTYLAIRRGIDCDVLRDYDLIDAPGISDPDLGKNALRFLQPHFDFVIWCTGASQAWRQTDKAAYAKLAKVTRDNSVLVVTRIDKLRNEKDRAKVLKRVNNETGDLFKHVVGLKTTKAAAVPVKDRSTEDAAWVETGGHDFMAAFKDALNATTPRSVPPKSAAKTKPKTKSESGKKAKKPSKAAPKSMDGDAAALTLIRSLETIKTMPQNGPYRHEIDHLIASIACSQLGQKQGMRVSPACSRIDNNDLEIDRLLSQIGRELGSFQSSDCIRLDA